MDLSGPSIDVKLKERKKERKMGREGKGALDFSFLKGWFVFKDWGNVL
jgi:hypothetical protein